MLDGKSTRNESEPWEGGTSPAAVARAMERAEVFADQCRHLSNTTIKRAVRPTAFNAAEQDSRCVKKTRALQKAYMTHLMRMVLAKLRDYLREQLGGIARL